MTSILPSITDKWRNKRNGKRRYVGQVLRFDGGTTTVIAEVYGDTLKEMRRRKHAVADALKLMENDPK